MIIIPALDIKEEKCVRLFQGKMDTATIYSDNPVKIAKKWEENGASLIHIIDLDGAFAKKAVNFHIIQNIINSIKTSVQVGGGIRDIKTIQKYIDAGAKKIIIGSKALYDKDFVKKVCKLFPNQIVVGIDAKNGMVAVEGWSKISKIKADELAKMFEDSGVAAINFTDINKDGMQTGVSIEATAALADSVSIPIVASGGVNTIEDIKALLKIEDKGVSGVIVGRALYEGSLDLKEAIKIAEQKIKNKTA